MWISAAWEADQFGHWVLFGERHAQAGGSENSRRAFVCFNRWDYHIFVLEVKNTDTRLYVSTVVDGKLVSWIESKALFGDEETHATYMKDQLRTYKNRYKFYNYTHKQALHIAWTNTMHSLWRTHMHSWFHSHTAVFYLSHARPHTSCTKLRASSLAHISFLKRFGPGLVIYWMGYVEELNHERAEEGIMLSDRFPTSIEVLRLNEK